MKQYKIATAKAGKLFYEELSLIDGRYLLTLQSLNPQAEEKDYRAAYFAKLETLGSEVGETKKDMHEYAKEHVLRPMMLQIPELFDSTELSTKSLSEEAWVIFLQRFDLWAWKEYNVIT